MKNRFIYLLLLFTLFSAELYAAKLSAFERQRVEQTLSRIVAREVSGGSVNLSAINASRGRVRIYASIGLSYYPFREHNIAAMYDSVRRALPAEFRKAKLELYTDGRRVEELVPLYYRSAAARKGVRGFTNRSERPLVTPLEAVPAPVRGLVGRHIALWQSHGRYFDQTENRWRWQRSHLWQTCEDLYTQSYVLPYLVPMLENAGANVLLPRERDVQKYEVLADNDVATQYTEHNGREPWADGGVGFAHRQAIYHTGENPFMQGTVRSVATITSSDAAAESCAVWRAEIPERGEYALYVSYRSMPRSADDATYTVHHLGGESRFAVNQTMGGGTWIYLGNFLLDAGEHQVVSLSNRSRQAGGTISADAVKIGGGFGNVARTPCDSLRKSGIDYADETSGYPRFCEGARYWLQWAGFAESVYTPKNSKDDYKDDYMSRAHWVNALMGGSERLPDSTGLRIPLDMALAFHSDAGVRDGDGIIGTLGIYYTRDNKGAFVGGIDRYRSRDLTDVVMTQIIHDIRRAFEPDWSRRGLWNRSYYEARVPCVPTMLLELLSHQNFADMRYGNDPRFKFAVSRAVYKGILRHISAQYNSPYVVQPLPVEALCAAFEGSDAVRLRWTPVVDSLEATAVPEGYMVYTRVDDGGFDGGRYAAEPTFTAVQEPGRIYSYRVTAINGGGESFPSEILAACRMPDEQGRVLIINGFDRVSAPASLCCDSLAGFYNDLDAGVADYRDIAFIGRQQVFDLSLARVNDDRRALGACKSDFATDVIGGNTFDYPHVHGAAVVQAGYSFCSSSVRAVERGEVSIDDYAAVDLILGKQRSVNRGRGLTGSSFKTFSLELQSALQKYLAHGGALFASGSYVATDLWTSPDATDEDRTFAREVLHYELSRGDAAQRAHVRVLNSRVGLTPDEFRFNDAIVNNCYSVEAPDALTPVGAGAFAAMRYVENDRTASVAYLGDGRTLVMGLPFETITDVEQRTRLMRGILNFLIKK